MFKLVAIVVLAATVFASAPCGCEDTISALEKRVAFLESKLNDVVGNSKHRPSWS